MWTPAQARQFLASVADDPDALLWRFYLATGCRRGEALGLRWSDVDLDAGRISITQQYTMVGAMPTMLAVKSDRSRRVVEERLGHSTVAFTLARYQKVLPGAQAEAASRYVGAPATRASPRKAARSCCASRPATSWTTSRPPLTPISRPTRPSVVARPMTKPERGPQPRGT